MATCHAASMTAVIVMFLAFVFGAGDQYLGNFSAHPWMADVSLLSAPWLVIAFAAGATQRDPKRAALIGTAATFAALIGYMLMTLSPIENAHLTLTSVGGFLVSSQRVFLGGLVTGPLFAWLGHRWRVHGSRAAGLVT